MIIGSLIELLNVANRQDRSGFSSSAELLRGIVVGEIVVAILGVLLLRMLGTRGRPIIAVAVLLGGVIDVVLSAQASIIP